MTALCEHKDGCTQPAVKWVEINDRRAGFCAAHAAVLERKLEGLRFHLGMLAAEMRCPECGNLVPEGFMRHDCGNPAPQPPAGEE